MALFRSVLTSGSRLISRNIRMSANLQEKAAEAMEKLKEGKKSICQLNYTIISLINQLQIIHTLKSMQQRLQSFNKHHQKNFYQRSRSKKMRKRKRKNRRKETIRNL